MVETGKACDWEGCFAFPTNVDFLRSGMSFGLSKQLISARLCSMSRDESSSISDGHLYLMLDILH